MFAPRWAPKMYVLIKLRDFVCFAEFLDLEQVILNFDNVKNSV